MWAKKRLPTRVRRVSPVHQLTHAWRVSCMQQLTHVRRVNWVQYVWRFSRMPLTSAERSVEFRHGRRAGSGVSAPPAGHAIPTAPAPAAQRARARPRAGPLSLWTHHARCCSTLNISSPNAGPSACSYIRKTIIWKADRLNTAFYCFIRCLLSQL